MLSSSPPCLKSRIEPHSHGAEIYDAIFNPAVVLSYNLSKDTIIIVCPKSNSLLSEFDSKITFQWYIKNRWVLPIYANQGSLIVMGGSFQRNMLHWTIMGLRRRWLGSVVNNQHIACQTEHLCSWFNCFAVINDLGLLLPVEVL